MQEGVGRGNNIQNHIETSSKKREISLYWGGEGGKTPQRNGKGDCLIEAEHDLLRLEGSFTNQKKTRPLRGRAIRAITGIG